MSRRAHSRILAALVAAAATVAATGFLCNGPVAPTKAPPRTSGGPTPHATAIAMPDAAPTATPIAPYPRGATGYAVSSPQCGTALPPPPFGFAVVGVTDGRAFRPNPCLRDEYRWAVAGALPAAVYLNTNYDPALRPDVMIVARIACGDDAACAAYLYGAASAKYAFEYARSQGVAAARWWLDVQIASTWAPDRHLNALAIKGAIDHLAGHGVRVGISSTPYQWHTVAGDASPGLPGWVAGAADAVQAAAYCKGHDFAGGRTEQIAYVADGFEMVRACGPAAP